MKSMWIPVRFGFALVFAFALAGGSVLAQGTKGVLIGLSQPAANSPVGTMEIHGISLGATPIYGFAFGVTNPVGTSVGEGAGAGKASLHDIGVTRLADAVSPQLFRAAALGVDIPHVKITLYASGKTVPEATYTLQDVRVSGLQSSPGLESLSFNYRSIRVQAGGAEFCFDVAANAAC
jgi:hypothetical protein